MLNRGAPAIGLLVLVLVAAAAPEAAAATFPVEFAALGGPVVLHRSYELYGGAPTASNGLIVSAAASALLIDTAWNDAETAAVLRYAAQTLRKPIRACVVTHSHADRAGGLAELARNGVEILMTEATHALLPAGLRGLAYTKLVPGPRRFDGIEFEVGFFGAGHTADNLVVYLPAERLLFGGCLVKAAAATDIGNTAEADLAAWSGTIRRLAAAYPEAVVVVPGHGAPGGREVLAHTLELLP
jgi:metallo-beta-lactamase class B